jgi:hypothetical protein
VAASDPNLPDAVIETAKNRVEIYQDRVVKTFKPRRGSARRARREAVALRRLEGLDGVPHLIEVSPGGYTVVMSRVPGTPLTNDGTLTEQQLVSLRSLLERMRLRGVARHSLPRRDILLGKDGSIGLVDFERSTQRTFFADPSWPVARMVARFNILRLINSHAPQMLTADEQAWLGRQARIRAALQHLLPLKRWISDHVGRLRTRRAG